MMDTNQEVVQFLIAEYTRLEEKIKDNKQKRTQDYSSADNEKVMKAIVEALGQSNNEDAEEFLLSRYHEQSAHEKHKFWNALGRIGGDNVARILIDDFAAIRHQDKENFYTSVGMTASPIAIAFLMAQFNADKVYGDEKVMILNALAIANK